jgi:hypothetical protein
MKKSVFCIAVAGLFLAGQAFADAASGLPTGKRQHKPVSTTQSTDDEQEETSVRNPMQEVKKLGATEPEPAGMNKAELTESLASKTGAEKEKAEKRVSETLRHKDRSVDDKTDKSENARAKRKKKDDQ